MNYQRNTWGTSKGKPEICLVLPAPSLFCAPVVIRVWLVWWLVVHRVWVGPPWSAWWRTEHRLWSWICRPPTVRRWLPVWGSAVPSLLLMWVKSALNTSAFDLTTLWRPFVMNLKGQKEEVLQAPPGSECVLLVWLLLPTGDLGGRRAGGGVSGQREVR